MRHLAAVLAAAITTLTANVALADEAAPPAQADDEGWNFRYKQARARLIAGDFATAAKMFDELAAETHDPLKRSLAGAQADLAREWQSRGLVLVKQSILGESGASAKSMNERTTDELAVLYTSSVLWGIGSGVWTSVLTKPDSAAGVVLPIFAFSGAAAGLVAAIDLSGRPFHYGVPQSIVSGLYIGLEEGIVLALWNNLARSSSDRWSGGTAATVIWGTSTAGALAGGILGSAVGTTPGRASFVGSTALWGGVLAGLIGGAVQSQDSNGQGALLLAGIGLNAGAIGGIVAAGPVSPSIARVRFLDLGGIVGGLVVGGLYFAAANKDPNTSAALGLTALGVAGGLTAAWFATSGMHPDRLEEHLDKPKPGEAKWSPTLMPTKDGMMLGVQGML